MRGVGVGRTLSLPLAWARAGAGSSWEGVGCEVWDTGAMGCTSDQKEDGRGECVGKCGLGVGCRGLSVTGGVGLWVQGDREVQGQQLHPLRRPCCPHQGTLAVVQLSA